MLNVDLHKFGVAYPVDVGNRKFADVDWLWNVDPKFTGFCLGNVARSFVRLRQRGRRFTGVGKMTL